MNKQIFKLLVLSGICACNSTIENQKMKGSESEGLVEKGLLANGLSKWYKEKLKDYTLGDIFNNHTILTGKEPNEEIFNLKLDEKILILDVKSQNKIFNFLEDFYRKSVLEFEKLNITEELRQTNTVFLLNMFSPLDLNKKTGKGRATKNYERARMYEERSYANTISSWNIVGVTPKIFVWDTDNEKIEAPNDCKFEICSIKDVLKQLSEKNDIFSKLIDIIEKIITNTEELKNLKEENENYNVCNKLNYQMRYGAVNLLRVIVMHYLSLQKENKDKILSYVDWVVTPTANLNKLPELPIIYAANVHSGLKYDGANPRENTAFFSKNSDNSQYVWDSKIIKNFYDKAYLFLNLLSKKYCNENIYEYVKNSDFQHTDAFLSIQNPMSFKSSDSFVYGEFLKLLSQLKTEAIKKLAYETPNVEHFKSITNKIFEEFDSIEINPEIENITYIYKNSLELIEKYIENEAERFNIELDLFNSKKNCTNIFEKEKVKEYDLSTKNEQNQILIKIIEEFKTKIRECIFPKIYQKIIQPYIEEESQKIHGSMLTMLTLITRSSGHA